MTSFGRRSGNPFQKIPERLMAAETSMPTASAGTFSAFQTSRTPPFETGTKYASPPRDAWAISSEVSFMQAESTSFMNAKPGEAFATSRDGADPGESGMGDMPFIRQLYDMLFRNATCRMAGTKTRTAALQNRE